MITKLEFERLNRSIRPSFTKDSVVRYRGKKLTNKQVCILEELGMGAGNQEIANKLGLSTRTIETHLQTLRKLVSSEIGYRLGDRELVLFARDMLDGYEVFVKLEEELKKNPTKAKIIEDWDDDWNDDELEPIILEEGYKTFNGKPVPVAEPRKYQENSFDIAEFKVQSKSISYKNGTYMLT
jgi:DNA-binding CsgD family transcriptional regulator